MTKELIYRNTAVIGALFLLANALFLEHNSQYNILSNVIEFVIVPITIISASFWYKINLVLIGVMVYFISYTYEVFQFLDVSSAENLFYEYKRIIQVLSPLGILFVIISGFQKIKEYGKYWFAKEIGKPEYSVLLVAFLTCLITSGIFLII